MEIEEINKILKKNLRKIIEDSLLYNQIWFMIYKDLKKEIIIDLCDYESLSFIKIEDVRKKLLEKKINSYKKYVFEFWEDNLEFFNFDYNLIIRNYNRFWKDFYS